MNKQDTAETGMAGQVAAGNRRALARAITLVESQKAEHRRQAAAVLADLPRDDHAIRIGLSGTPGVGKSTFVESFGMMLVDAGLKVAVLAVDPSSSRSGGSILGDKTRMDLLSRHPNAFIRPSPSQSQLGGVARRTREAATLCGAAGYDVILIETVGVGQSETMVGEMVDVFVLLLAPAGGDELQGVKRGIMEMADLILINKADGDLKATARRTCADYSGALRLMRKRHQDPEDFPKAMMVSALEQDGLGPAWDEMQSLITWRKSNGVWEENRRDQAVHWFKAEVRDAPLTRLGNDEQAGDLFKALQSQVQTGEIAPSVAAEDLVAAFLGK